MLKIIIPAALALGGTALAQDYEAQDYDTQDYSTGQPEAEMSVGDAFAAMDADLDGSVTRDEFVAYAGEGSETQFDAAAGDDGLLTEDELSAFVVTPEEVVGEE